MLATAVSAVAALPTAGAQARPTARDDARAPVPRELAIALVDAGRPLRTDSVSVRVGHLPEGFPAAPLPASGRVLGGVQWRSGATLAVLALDEAPAAARARLLAAFDSAGWRPPPAADAFQPDYPRFISSPPPDAEREATRCAPTGGGAVILGVRARDGAAGALGRVLALPPAQATRCRPPNRPAFVNRDRERTPPLPGLRPPPNARVDVAFESGGTVMSYQTTSRATGDSLDPGVFLAHYRRELAAAGWVAVSMPAWDTTRSTPLFVSPPDSAGARWAGSVSAERDSARGVRLTLVVAPVASAGTRSSMRGEMAAGGFASYSSTALASPSDVPGATRPTRTTLGPDTSAPLPRELVDALLSISPFGGGDNQAAIVVGRAPVGWTAPVPAATGRHVLGGRTGQAPVALDVFAVAVPGTPAQAQAAYLQQLDQAGWRAARDLAGAGTRFRGFLPGPATVTPGAASVGFTRCAPGRDAVLSGTAVARRAGGSVLRLVTFRETVAAQCAPAGRGGAPDLTALEMAQAPVPALTPPTGLLVTGGSAGGGFDMWRADAVVRGAASPDAVVEAYAPQLRAAGWSVGAVAGAPDVAAVRLTRGADAAGDSAAALAGFPASRLGPWTGVLTAARREDGAYAVALTADRRRR